jgi:hypothetical protein
MERRRFLGLIGGTAVAALSVACGASPDLEQSALARPDLLDALGAERVRALGVRYRQMMPAERDAASLRDAIRRSLPAAARLSGNGPSPLARLVHDDFDGGRTVVVDGWILSATEARPCALFSLGQA